MNTLSINLPDEFLQKLKEVAIRYQVTPEELVLASIEEFLSRPEETFQMALEYVLKKNADLYRRLA
jgi:predicted transcriptional regulator